MSPLPRGQSECNQQRSRVSDSWLCAKNPESCQECAQVFLSEWMKDTELFFSHSSWDKGFFFWGGSGGRFGSRENGNNLERTRSSEEWWSIERESPHSRGGHWSWGTRMSEGQRWKSKGSVRMPGGEKELGFFEDLKWGPASFTVP